MTSVVVVGGGVSGLVAARELARRGCTVTVLEAGTRCGGKLTALELDGVRLDAGAESMLARRPEAIGLCGELGLGLVYPTAAAPELLVAGRPRPLPPSMLGVPTDLDALGGMLSPAGLRRARREPDLPAPPLAGDVAFGQFVDERFGSEVTDRLVEPLLGGVYAGRARDLSFEAIAPGLFARARAGGSLLAAAQAEARPTVGTPVFAGLAGGVSRLADALVADGTARGVRLRSGVTVTAVAASDAGFVVTGHTGGGVETWRADGVLLATPARPTGRLLGRVVPSAAGWAGWPYASLAVVTLVVAGLEPGPSGLLVAPGELPTIKALTYSSTKWEWVRAAATHRWGEGATVIRASVGRLGEEHLLQADDPLLRDRTYAEARKLPGWADARLLAGRVTRWGGSLPQYGVGHRQRVSALRGELARHPGLALCGAALDGVGIAACLGSAALAVNKITADLSAA